MLLLKLLEKYHKVLTISLLKLLKKPFTESRTLELRVMAGARYYYPLCKTLCTELKLDQMKSGIGGGNLLRADTRTEIIPERDAVDPIVEAVPQKQTENVGGRISLDRASLLITSIVTMNHITSMRGSGETVMSLLDMENGGR